MGHFTAISGVLYTRRDVPLVQAAAEMDVDDFLDGGFEDLGGESDMDSDVPSGSDGEEEGSDIADSEEDEGKEEEGGGDDSSSDMDDEDVIRMLAQSREAEEQVLACAIARA